MNPNPPDQKVTYFIVTPQNFQAVVNKLGELPYKEIAGIMQNFLTQSRAMFDPVPPVPKMEGPGGRVVTDPDGTMPPAKPPVSAKPNGAKQPDAPTATPDSDLRDLTPAPGLPEGVHNRDTTEATPADETLPDDIPKIVDPDKPGGAE